jgi:type I restriction enzyme M protein
MSNNTSSIVSKVWSFCNPLRDVGVGYGDYLEQLTYLLFLKMADEYSKPPHKRELPIPKEFNWESLTNKKGAELELHYAVLLRELSTAKGILGQIFTKSQNKIQDPAMLAKIIDMIDSELWLVMGADLKGDIYEKLLEQNAQDVKSGAGQYFTPRPLIRAMVECVQPQPMKTIADPACGTGGFFLAAYDYIVENYKLDKEQNKFLKMQTFFGNEIVAGTNPEGRWRKFTYEEIIARDKTSLDISWLKDKSLADLDNLPDPEELAEDIIENLEAGLASFREIMIALNTK